MWRASRKIWRNNWTVFKVAPGILFSESTNINAKCPNRYPWNLWIWVLCFQMTMERYLKAFSRIAYIVAQTMSVGSYSTLAVFALYCRNSRWDLLPKLDVKLQGCILSPCKSTQTCWLQWTDASLHSIPIYTTYFPCYCFGTNLAVPTVEGVLRLHSLKFVRNFTMPESTRWLKICIICALRNLQTAISTGFQSSYAL